jgi:hypothetical protein
MKTEKEIKDKIKKCENYLKKHGGPFGEGVESQIAVLYALRWVLEDLSKEEEKELDDSLKDY